MSGEPVITLHYSEYYAPVCPWHFSIQYQGRTLQFAGMPNRCRTKRSAMARAAWRAKWLREGTFDQRYLATP